MGCFGGGAGFFAVVGLLMLELKLKLRLVVDEGLRSGCYEQQGRLNISFGVGLASSYSISTRTLHWKVLFFFRWWLFLGVGDVEFY